MCAWCLVIDWLLLEFSRLAPSDPRIATRSIVALIRIKLILQTVTCLHCSWLGSKGTRWTECMVWICMHGAMHWTGIPFTMYSHLALSVCRIYFGFIATLTRIKPLQMKMIMRINSAQSSSNPTHLFYIMPWSGFCSKVSFFFLFFSLASQDLLGTETNILRNNVLFILYEVCSISAANRTCHQTCRRKSRSVKRHFRCCKKAILHFL